MANVLDTDFETEAVLSMLVAGKKAFVDWISQTSLANKKSKTNCIPKNRIYLDSCSTYISLLNEELLEEIDQIDTIVLGHTNTGTSKTNWVGKYGVVEAWLVVSSIYNIFSLTALKNIWCHITYDSDDGYYLVTNSNTDVATKFIED